MGRRASRSIDTGDPSAAPLGQVPRAATEQRQHGRVELRGRVQVQVATGLLPAVRPWARDMAAAFDLDIALTSPGGTTSAARPPAVDLSLQTDLPAGGYTLRVEGETVRIGCADLAGGHAAVRTLYQLAGPHAYRRSARPGRPLTLPRAEITDHPRFTWRGVLLDVARHFLPKADVLRFIDQAADLKLNRLQLHLTDDQGWRMQVHRYPRLTEVGSWRTESGLGSWRAGVQDGTPHGGCYTQDDLREIAGYAADRGITVVPEIDVPGHVQAMLAAYPELGVGGTPVDVRTTWGISEHVLDPDERALTFVTHVLEEVLEVFDSPWIALGGDEVPTTRWQDDPQIRARAASLGLAHVGELHGWFLAQVCQHVLDRGRRPVVWDEGFSAQLPTATVVTSWRGWGQGVRALAAGHDVVMAPEQVVYLDHRAGDGPDEPVPVGFLRTVADVYAFDPLPAAVAGTLPPGSGTLLGAQAQVWTEHLTDARRVDFATHPRLAAFAEVVWSPEQDRAPGSPASTEFLDRLAQEHLPRLDAAGVEYRPLDGPHPWQMRPGVSGHLRDLDAELAAGGWDGTGGWAEPGGAP